MPRVISIPNGYSHLISNSPLSRELPAASPLVLTGGAKRSHPIIDISSDEEGGEQSRGPKRQHQLPNACSAFTLYTNGTLSGSRDLDGSWLGRWRHGFHHGGPELGNVFDELFPYWDDGFSWGEWWPLIARQHITQNIDDFLSVTGRWFSIAGRWKLLASHVFSKYGSKETNCVVSNNKYALYKSNTHQSYSIRCRLFSTAIKISVAHRHTHNPCALIFQSLSVLHWMEVLRGHCTSSVECPGPSLNKFERCNYFLTSRLPQLQVACS